MNTGTSYHVWFQTDVNNFFQSLLKRQNISRHRTTLTTDLSLRVYFLMIYLPSSRVLILKSIPIVEMKDGLNVFSAKRNIMHVFPTPLSPMRRSLKNKSKFGFAISRDCFQFALRYVTVRVAYGSGEWLLIANRNRKLRIAHARPNKVKNKMKHEEQEPHTFFKADYMNIFAYIRCCARRVRKLGNMHCVLTRPVLTYSCTAVVDFILNFGHVILGDCIRPARPK